MDDFWKLTFSAAASYNRIAMPVVPLPARRRRDAGRALETDVAASTADVYRRSLAGVVAGLFDDGRSVARARLVAAAVEWDARRGGRPRS